MTFGESKYFDSGLLKSRDNGNTANIISVVRYPLFLPLFSFLWMVVSDREPAAM